MDGESTREGNPGGRVDTVILHGVEMVLRDPYCGRTPEEIDAYTPFAESEGLTNTEYVLENEGTLNEMNGHFACNECYIKIGMPSSPSGWKAP